MVEINGLLMKEWQSCTLDSGTDNTDVLLPIQRIETQSLCKGTSKDQILAWEMTC